jgi:glutathione S-transferase
MKLYYHPLSSNCRRVLAALHFAGRDDIELIQVDFSKGEHKAPDFLAVNPNGKLPALSDGDFNLWESNAIMQYISADSSAWPPSKVRYDIARWQFWTTAHFGRAAGTIAFENVIKPVFYGGQTNPAAVAEATTELNRFAAVLDAHLAGGEWLVGDGPTLADFSVGADVGNALFAKADLSAFPNLMAWWGRLSDLEAWQKSAPSA